MRFSLCLVVVLVAAALPAVASARVNPQTAGLQVAHCALAQPGAGRQLLLRQIHPVPARPQQRTGRPLLAADQPQAPPGLRQGLRVIDQHVDDYITRARLGKAA